MRTRIKICGITRSEDARAAVELGADALGFVFYPPSPRHVEIEQAASLVAMLPPFVQSVALFMDAEAGYVRDVLVAVPFDLLQFHGSETPEFCAAFGRPYIKSVPMGGGVEPREYAAKFADSRGFLLDSNAVGQAGGSGHAFDWSAVPDLGGRPLILAGGLNPDNVAEGVRTVRPWAIDVSSGVEAAKGLKDRARMQRFIEEIKRVDSE
jgi:phosphoribosylanthranilate isomerase